MRPVVLALVSLAACIRPADKLACGNAECPLTDVCIDGAFCVLPEAVSACAGSTAGGACSVAGRPGRCAPHSDLLCEPSVCGDNVVDDALHEACDGTAPVTAQCVDLGYDIGRPGCTTACGLDATSCARFGWEVTINEPIYAMWTDATTVAYARHAPESVIIKGGGYNVDVEVANVSRIRGGPGRVAFLGTGGLWLATPTGVENITSPSAAAQTFIDVDIASDGTLYASVGCTLWMYTTTWTALWSGTGTDCAYSIGVSSSPTNPRILFERPSGLYELVNGAPVQLRALSSPISQIEFRTVRGVERAYVGFLGGLLEVTGNSVVQVSFNASTSLAITNDLVFSMDQGQVTRWDGTRIDIMRAPTATLTDDHHGALLSYGGIVYRFTGIDFGELPPVPINILGDDHMTSLAELPDGQFLAGSTLNVVTQNSKGAGWDQPGTQLFGTPLHAIAALSLTQRAVAGYAPLNTGALIKRENTPNTFADITPSSQPAVDGLWMAADGTLFAAGVVGTSGYLGRIAWNATQWEETMLPDCEMHGVYGRSVTDVYAVGACGGAAVVLHYDGTAWTELHRDPSITMPLYGVRAYATGEIFAAGDGGGVWRTAGTWNASLAVRGRSLSGTPTDMWMAGSFTAIQHFDGTQWSEVTTRVLGPAVIMATPDRVIIPGGAPGHVALLRSP